LQQCGDFQFRIKQLLGQNITIPPGASSIIPFRVLSLFTSASRAELREEILKQFCKCNTNLRLVIATTAFSLGVDCRDITRVINWGSPNSLEELVQETGRAGRDGREAEAILYYGKGASRHISKAAKNYGKNNLIVGENCYIKISYLVTLLLHVYVVTCVLQCVLVLLVKMIN